MKLDVDLTTSKYPRAGALELEDPVSGTSQQFDETYGALRAEGRRPGMEHMVKHGLRAQLKTGSLLTGQLFVELDFIPTVRHWSWFTADSIPDPTILGTLEAFRRRPWIS